MAALRDLEPPFDAIFDAEKMRHDKVLHWNMRSVRPDLSESKRLADQGVILIGDAAHAIPVLSGEGANIAIKDGIDLAEHIATKGVDSLADFVVSRHAMWKTVVEESEKRLREMHELSPLTT